MSYEEPMIVSSDSDSDDHFSSRPANINSFGGFRGSSRGSIQSVSTPPRISIFAIAARFNGSWQSRVNRSTERVHTVTPFPFAEEPDEEVDVIFSQAFVPRDVAPHTSIGRRVRPISVELGDDYDTKVTVESEAEAEPMATIEGDDDAANNAYDETNQGSSFQHSFRAPQPPTGRYVTRQTVKLEEAMEDSLPPAANPRELHARAGTLHRGRSRTLMPYPDPARSNAARNPHSRGDDDPPIVEAVVPSVETEPQHTDDGVDEPRPAERAGPSIASTPGRLDQGTRSGASYRNLYAGSLGKSIEAMFWRSLEEHEQDALSCGGELSITEIKLSQHRDNAKFPWLKSQTNVVFDASTGHWLELKCWKCKKPWEPALRPGKKQIFVGMRSLRKHIDSCGRPKPRRELDYDNFLANVRASCFRVSVTIDENGCVCVKPMTSGQAI